MESLLQLAGTLNRISKVSTDQEGMRELQTLVRGGVDRFKRDRQLDLRYVTGIVVPKLKEVMGEICGEISQRHMIEQEENGESIFVTHYTNIGTLFSMLQRAAKGEIASLRLYDSLHFNDPDEGYYFLRNLLTGHDWLRVDRGYSSHAYIVSFVAPSANSEKDSNDDLVFWRTYGREGEGCSLTVSVPKSRLRRVSYDAEEAKGAAEELLPALHTVKQLASVNSEVRETLARAFWESLKGIQFLYKSEAYDYENEFRFIVSDSDVDENDICFEYRDISPVNIRHYCEHEDLAVEKMFISESTITIGPCVLNYDDLRHVLGILTRRAELYGVRIFQSKISYRKS